MNYNKLLKEDIDLLIKQISLAVQILSPIKKDSYKRNVKYTIDDYIIGVVSILKSGVSWNSYVGTINGNTLRKKHSEWDKLGIYDYIYKNSLNKYLKTMPITEELKYQSIDSTFIEDVNGSKCASYSGIYKRRKGEASKGIKISSLVTSSGIPISTTIDSANKYDSPLLPNIVDNCVIECNTKKYANHNRYKQYLLADSGYDSKANHKLLRKKGYTPIIIPNNRNTKNKKKIRKLNKKQKTIYKKRTIIENYHSWIKKFKRIESLYERNINNYRGLLMLGITIIINRRTDNK